MKKRQNFDKAFKAKVVLEALREELIRDIIDSCGWDRKRTFIQGKVLLPHNSAKKVV